MEFNPAFFEHAVPSPPPWQAEEPELARSLWAEHGWALKARHVVAILAVVGAVSAILTALG